MYYQVSLYERTLKNGLKLETTADLNYHSGR